MLVSTDYDVIERVAKILGKAGSKTRTSWEHKQRYTVTLSGHRCRVWMLRLLPYMGSRRKARIIELLKSCEPTLVVAAVQAASGITGKQVQMETN